ncbi:unnamed protein product [Rotaria sp. Silwood2]|nr:unnamed protein product [Rotaria sp. Silwood2]
MKYIFFIDLMDNHKVVKQDSIETDIEKHSTVISNLLAFDHNLLNETDISQRNIHSLSRTVQTLEQRWILLKELIMKQKFE